MYILCATDGSERALAAAHVLARLPLEQDCRLTLFTVLPEGEDRDADTVLASAREALRGTGATLVTASSRGNAAEEILRFADPADSRAAVDLIVVGWSGLSGVSRFFLGSVAERVARHAPCSTLVARPIVHGLRKAIVAVDGSEGAARAARWLRGFPLPADCELALTTVLPPREAALLAEDMAWPILSDELSQLYEEEQRRAHQRLAVLAAELTAAGKRAISSLETGDAASTLLQIAEAHAADLIVVGAQGHSQIERFLLGSVSEKVLRHAHCSVLVVRERERKQ